MNFFQPLLPGVVAVTFKTAFVTGGTGFVGRNLVLELLKQDWDVHILYHTDKTYKAFQDVLVRNHCVASDRIHYAQGDVRQKATVEAALASIDKVDAVFHLAGLAELPSADARKQLQRSTSVEGSRNVAEAALVKLVKGTGRYIQMTVSAARAPPKPGLPDWRQFNLFATRQDADKEVEKLIAGDKGLPAVFIGPSIILGPDDDDWSNLIRMISSTRFMPFFAGGINGFCNVKNVVKACIAAADPDRSKIGAHYVLGGYHTSFLHVARMVNSILGTHNWGPWCAAPPKLIQLAGIGADWAWAGRNFLHRNFPAHFGPPGPPKFTSSMTNLITRDAANETSANATSDLGYRETERDFDAALVDDIQSLLDRGLMSGPKSGDAPRLRATFPPALSH